MGSHAPSSEDFYFQRVDAVMQRAYHSWRWSLSNCAAHNIECSLDVLAGVSVLTRHKPGCGTYRDCSSLRGLQMGAGHTGGSQGGQAVAYLQPSAAGAGQDPRWPVECCSGETSALARDGQVRLLRQCETLSCCFIICVRCSSKASLSVWDAQGRLHHQCEMLR